MDELRECRACQALLGQDEPRCPQCGSDLLAEVGVALAQQLAIKQAREAFEATYHTWGRNGWDGVGLDMSRHRVAVRYQDGYRRQCKVIEGCQIIGVKVVEAAGVTHTRTQGGSALGRAALGGVLFGGVGALLGGMSAKQQSCGTVIGIDVVIATREPGWPLLTIPLLAGAWRADSEQVAQGRRAATVWAARVDDMIRQCAITPVIAQGGASVADELGKLVWLRDHGEISAQECERLKRQLLAARLE